MQYYKGIFFTKVPLKGYYRYKDEFQIYPIEIPEDVPRKQAVRHFPNTIEYLVRDGEEIEVRNEEEFSDLDDLSSLTATTVTNQERLLNLLTTFSNSLFFPYNGMDGSWGMPILSEDRESLNKQNSVWCMKMFYFKEFIGPSEIKGLTKLNMKEIELIQNLDFYQVNPNLDTDRTKGLFLPMGLTETFDGYFSLNKEMRTVIDTAVAYAVSAVELKDSRKTLSLLSSFTALETMVNLEFKGNKPGKCEACGELKFSVAKKFREYLLNYLGDSPFNRKKFNLYYSLRSKIVHTGQQLKTEALWNNLTQEEYQKERITRIEILQIAKIAIVNWLIINHRSKMAQKV